jgi:NDP-sugar pyrophosphorylase family protein
LGMADALQRAAPLITGNFILSACDNLIHVDNIARMLSIWQADEHPNAILALIPVAPEQVSGAGIVAMDGDWVIQIIEKPDLDQAPSNIASLPLYCLPREILDYLPEIKISARGEYELQDAIQLLIDRRGHVRGFLVNHRLTLTSPADLLAINRHFLVSGDNQPQLQPQTVGPNTHLITPLHIEGGTRIGENCTIGPNVYIERYCNIGDNTKIKNAILLRGSVIPENTDITDQVVDHLI